MPAPKIFNNIILGQFVLTGVPVKVYASGRFLTLTDADDIEDPTIGFGMDENGAMVQFSYPEVEFLSVQGNRVDIATYNKGMETLHGGGDESPAQKEPEDEKDADADSAEDADGKPKGAGDFDPTQESYIKRGKDMKLKDLLNENVLGDLPSSKLMKMKWNPLGEISQDEVDAEVEGASAAMDAAKAKLKASQAAMKTTMQSSKEKIKAAKSQPIDDGVVADNNSGYTFGTGDIVNNRDVSCNHHGAKGFVIQFSADDVKYSVTNGGDGKSYKPGDVLTNRTDQLEKI
tara:strand:- start:443 stop:1306 length:864 start_codon:yes stop_codon:yes gene_type:complete